jgi:hypothetical protein
LPTKWPSSARYGRGLAADGGVDLERKAELSRPARRLDRAVERPRGEPEAVVQIRAREVERERDLVEARVLELREPLERQLLRGGRYRRDAQASGLSVADELGEVGAAERIAAAQDEERRAHVGDGVDEAQAFVG